LSHSASPTLSCGLISSEPAVKSVSGFHIGVSGSFLGEPETDSGGVKFWVEGEASTTGNVVSGCRIFCIQPSYFCAFRQAFGTLRGGSVNSSMKASLELELVPVPSSGWYWRRDLKRGLLDRTCRVAGILDSILAVGIIGLIVRFRSFKSCETMEAGI